MDKERRRERREEGRSGPFEVTPVSCFSSLFSFFHFVFDEKNVFFFLVFLSNMFYCWHQYQSLTVKFSSFVGAPWRCGVRTTQGGMAGIGLGRLLGREHASTPQSGVEAPRLLKRSLLQIVLLLLLFW